MLRRPAVSGKFYPSSRKELSEIIQKNTDADAKKEKVIGIVSPHAGLMYSGMVAGAVYSEIEFPKTFILIGPNHTGLGKPVSIVSSGKWEMPNGTAEVDTAVAEALKARSEIFEENELAHLMEHSLEVQLPFMLHFSPDIKIVPITIMANTLKVCSAVGEAVADVIKETDYPVTIVASSDMSHYVSDVVARRNDAKAIEKVIELDPEGLFSIVKKQSISMCGVIPVTAMLYAAARLGSKEGRLVKYMTSGEITDDMDNVVGYAGMTVK